ncbi:MAG: ABC transporter substrate-binding protein, partial [Actinomycetota bacterium]
MRAKLLVAFLLLSAACTDAGPPAPDRTASPSPTEAAVQPPTPSPTFTGFSEDHEVLDVAITEPFTLDPMRIRDPGSVLVVRQLFESLTAWDQASEQVVPAAAESWEVSRGGRRFTFRIRPGTTFHDGSPITSQDFAYAFNRIASKQNAAEIAYTLERVEGFTAVNQTGSSDRLSGIKTPDESTLVIDLSSPYYEFPAVLTHPGLVPLQRKHVEDEETFLTMPIGNGPFQMATPWSPGGEIVMQRFPGFVRTPPLDGIVFHPFPDAAAAYLGFVDEEFDVAEVPVGQTETAAEVYGDRGYVPFLA